MNKTNGTIEKLIAEHKRLELCARDKAQELDSVLADLKAFGVRLFEADPKSRQKLIDEFAQLSTIKGALALELEVVQSLRDEALLAVCEYELEQKQARSDELREALHRVKEQMNSALIELRKFRNGGGRRLSQDDRDKMAVELETKVARLKATSLITQRDFQRAGYQREQAQAELDEKRRSLGLDKQGESVGAGRGR